MAKQSCWPCSRPSACTESSINQASTPVARSLASGTNIAVYGSEGPILRQYTLDLSTGQLAAGSSVSFPAGVQYAAVARKADHLYVSAGNQPLNSQLFAFDIAPGSGALSPRGAPLAPSGGRSINLSVNHQGTHLALAHSSANRAAIVELAADGSMVGEVPQTGATATGPFPHQAKFDQAGQNLIVPGLALNGGDGTLTVFRFGEGQLTHAQTVTLAPGLGARHVEFDHSGRFVYLTVERGNRLHTYRFADGLLSATPIFDRTTLADQANNSLRTPAGGRDPRASRARRSCTCPTARTRSMGPVRCRAKTTSPSSRSMSPPASPRRSSTSTPAASRLAASPSIRRGNI